MKIIPTDLPEVLIIEPRVFEDERGFFMESYNARAFNAAVGYEVQFVQDNQSHSRRGVLRGLHYQLPPHAQGKLVRVTLGCVFDVAVDMRRSSPRFGQSIGIELSRNNRRQLWIPPGFAHGYLVLSSSADFLYKTTGHYVPQAERSLRWADPALDIQWPEAGMPPMLSDRDLAAPMLCDADSFD